MPYAVAAAAIAAGGAVYQADQAKSAAGQQVGASEKSIDAQNRQALLARADNAQFMGTGNTANARLKTLLGLDAGAMGGPGGPKDYKDWTRSDFVNAYQKLFTERGHPDQPLAAITSELDNRIGDISNPEVRQYFDDIGLMKYAPIAAGTPAGGGTEGSPLLRKFSSADLEADPVYNSGLKFGADQGRDAINARATQAGNYDSGATLKALTRFGTDYGSTKANESYNRFTTDQNNVFNKLSGISGTGQVATSQVGASGANAVNNISGSIDAAGNARAAGIVGGANAWGNAGASTNSAMNNYQNNQLLKQLLAKNNGGASGGTGYSGAGNSYAGGYGDTY